MQPSNKQVILIQAHTKLGQMQVKAFSDVPESSDVTSAQSDRLPGAVQVGKFNGCHWICAGRLGLWSTMCFGNHQSYVPRLHTGL